VIRPALTGTATLTRAIAVLPLCIAVFSSCVASQVPLPRDVPSLFGCEYLTFYVAPENMMLWEGIPPEDVELSRQQFAALAASAFQGFGLRQVEDASQASLLLVTVAWLYDTVGSGEHALITFRLGGTLRFRHRLSTLALANPAFPIREQLNEFRFEVRRGTAAGRYAAEIRSGARKLWSEEAEQVRAACDAQATLRADGWDSIEQFRQRLVEETARLRRERADATRP